MTDPVRRGGRRALPADVHEAMLRLEAEIAAEDAEDARSEALRIEQGLPEPRRTIRTAPHWADGGVAPRQPTG